MPALTKDSMNKVNLLCEAESLGYKINLITTEVIPVSYDWEFQVFQGSSHKEAWIGWIYFVAQIHYEAFHCILCVYLIARL